MFDITRGAELPEGNIPESVTDQFISDSIEETYHDKAKLLNFVSESLNCSQFALDVMEAYFEYDASKGSSVDLAEFTALVLERCKWFRHDMAKDIVAE